MKQILLILAFTLAVVAAYSQRLNINLGTGSYPLENLQSITLDSIGLTPDSTDSYYNVIVTSNTPVIILELDTTVYSTTVDTIKYLRGQDINAALYNSIGNITNFFAQARTWLSGEDQVIVNLSNVNPVMIQLTGDGYATQSTARYINEYTGYWKLKYNATTRYFIIQSDASITEVTLSGENVIPVISGYTGTLQVLGPRFINLKNLIPGNANLRLGSPSGTNKKFVTSVEADVEFSYLPSVWQNRTFVP